MMRKPSTELAAAALSNAAPTKWRAVKRVAPFFLVGPVSGPLLAGVVLNLKDGHPILAGLYAVALIEYIILLPTLVAKLGMDLV
jgi:hypothetical protein